MYRLAPLPLLAGLLLAGAPAPALAQTRAAAAARLEAEFARTDRDHDGYVSRNEFARRIAGTHIAGRGVTPDETRALAAHWFARADRNGDGRVSRDEAQALFAQTFARADSNRDGRLDARERKRAEANLLGEGMR